MNRHAWDVEIPLQQLRCRSVAVFPESMQSFRKAWQRNHSPVNRPSPN